MFNTVVGKDLIRGQHKADAEEEGENGEDRKNILIVIVNLPGPLAEGEMPSALPI